MDTALVSGVVAIVVALIGGGTTLAGVVLTRRSERGRQAAEIEQITATAVESAHKEINGRYGELLRAQADTMAQIQAYSQDAHRRARNAEQRAAQAEVTAENAQDGLRSAIRLLIALRPLIIAHIPDSDTWVKAVDELTVGR